MSIFSFCNHIFSAFNVALIGFISQEMFKLSSPGWNIKIGMLFSAIVSATDPIAAVALLKEAGLFLLIYFSLTEKTLLYTYHVFL
jgi:NhaP-type Na+/H+ or K+/H+ antiporter